MVPDSAPACLVVIAAAARCEHKAMLAWHGPALGFDAHAMLVAPFFVSMAIGRRGSLWLLAIAPLIAAALVKPGANDKPLMLRTA